MQQREALTEHQENWWGTQKCRRCNFLGLPPREGDLAVVPCPDCDGSGWTEWAALATQPWSEIIPNLFVGGHDYNAAYAGTQRIAHAFPGRNFDVVVSMYRRDGFEPNVNVEQHEHLVNDSRLDSEMTREAVTAARIVRDRYRAGRKILVRCQAGLNRSSLVAGLAMVGLGFSGADAIQIIRTRRSPWAVCNEHYEKFLLSEEPVRAMQEAHTHMGSKK